MFNFCKENIDNQYKVEHSPPYVCNGFLVICDCSERLQFIRISSIESIWYDPSDRCTIISTIGSDTGYDTGVSAQFVFDVIKDYLV